MKENKIKFEDLGLTLKLAVVGGYIALIVFVSSFMVGFIQGLMV